MSKDWNPHTLQHCVDSVVLGWSTGVLALGMLIWYIAIAKRWYESMQNASKGGRSIWGWLVAIFIICAMAGYVSWIMALFAPKVAVIFRLTFLTLQNIACPFFWIKARKYKFHLQGAYEHIGQTLATSDIQHMENEKLAALTKKLVFTCLERQTELRRADVF